MKKLLIVLGICVSIAHGQAARFGDQNPTQTTVIVPGVSGQLVKVVPTAIIQFCAWPANAVPCTNKVTTYTDITLTTPCATSTQVVLSGTSNCVGTADALGNWGVWVPPGTYQYTFTYNGNNYGPFYALPVGATVATLNCPAAINGAIGAMNSPTAFNCDPSLLTDFAGNLTGQSAQFLGPVNGFTTYIGGGSAPGTLVKFKLPANAFRIAAPTTVGTPYYFVPPAVRCSVGQVWGLAAETTDANGDKVDTYQCQNAAASAGVEAQTNAVDNANCVATVCPLLNNQSGIGVTVTNPSGGIDNYALTGATQLATPAAPTLTVNGSAGGTTITYKVVAIEDPYSVYHTPASAATSTSTANATLSSSNSITLSGYGDTLYGARCFNIYRTAAGGSPSTVGLIASCVGKTFVDTGLVGDTTTAPTTNNTILVPHMASLPLGNIPPNGVIGVDAPPFATNASDDDFGNSQGAPADVNNTVWTWGNQNSATALWSNGALVLTIDTGGQYEGLLRALPGSTPYTFIMYVDVHAVAAPSGCAIGFRESSTGKMAIVELNNNNGAGSVAANGAYLLQTEKGTSYTFGSQLGVWGYRSEGVYLKIQNDATNVNFSYSLDGIIYQGLSPSTAIATTFTTAPNQLFVGGRSSTTSALCVIDYVRRTQ